MAADLVYCCPQCYEKTLELVAAHEELQQAYWQTLHALATALDVREANTGMHSRRVAEMTRLLAQLMGCSTNEQNDFYRGALLHDIGKIGIPDGILLKPGPLTAAEWKLMRLHPEMGFRILESVAFLRPAAEIVLAHQERYDGQGYPRRLRGDEIPLGARLFALADTLDAVTADRPYRRGQPFDAGRTAIEGGTGSQFDPRVVEVFAEHASAFRALTEQPGGAGLTPETCSSWPPIRG